MSATQTELHRHLDVSLRPATFLELLQERGHEAKSTSLEAFTQKLILRQPMTDLNAVIAAFQRFQAVFDRPEVLDRIAYEVVEDCYREGTRKVELRWSPAFVSEWTKLPWADALDGFEAGMKRALAKYPDMKAGMICIISREYGPDAAARTVELLLKHRSRFIGLDLAGSDGDYPARTFLQAFQPALGAGVPITIHAGESSGPEQIWDAIEVLGARRIGHGIACIRDPRLMEYLASEEICLEMCPTSNWLTRCVPSLKEHPIAQVLRAGVPVCVNTDDPGMFGVTLGDEVRICREQVGMSETEIDRMFSHAEKHSFLG